MHLAVVGKGGSGKSVVAGTLARLLARAGRSVLTLDSDTMPGLSLSLGLGACSEAMLAGAVEKNDQGRWRLRRGIGPVRAVERFAVTAPDGVRHLQLGKLDERGQAAVLPSSHGFYQVIHRLSDSRTFADWAVIGDLAAGPRQLAYDWAPYARIFLLMVEPTWKSALTARRLAAILRSRPGTMVVPVASRVSGAPERRQVERMLGEPTVAEIPFDAAVAAAERRGVAPIDHAPRSAAMRAIERLAAVLHERAGEGQAA